MSPEGYPTRVAGVQALGTGLPKSLRIGCWCSHPFTLFKFDLEADGLYKLIHDLDQDGDLTMDELIRPTFVMTHAGKADSRCDSLICICLASTGALHGSKGRREAMTCRCSCGRSDTVCYNQL